jgi:multiple sugar transport system permease protein
MAGSIGTPASAIVRSRSRWAALRRCWTWYLFIAPSLILFLVFTLFIWAFMIYLSFQDWSLIGPRAFVGLGNYRELLVNEHFWSAFRVTLVYTLIFVGPVAAISLLVAALVNQRLPLIGVFRSAYFLPVVTSISVIALVWRFILIPRAEGPLNYLIGWLGLPPQEWLIDTGLALPSVTGMQIWATAGYYMILWLAGLQGIPQHLYEAAAIDGAGRWRRFTAITLPLLTPTTFFVLVISLIHAFQVFDTVQVMTGGGPADASRTMVVFIYDQGFRFLKMGYAAAVAWLLFVFIFIVTLAQWRVQKRWVSYD